MGHVGNAKIDTNEVPPWLPCGCKQVSGSSISQFSTCPCGLSGYCQICHTTFKWFSGPHICGPREQIDDVDRIEALALCLPEIQGCTCYDLPCGGDTTSCWQCLRAAAGMITDLKGRGWSLQVNIKRLFGKQVDGD